MIVQLIVAPLMSRSLARLGIATFTAVMSRMTINWATRSSGRSRLGVRCESLVGSWGACVLWCIVVSFSRVDCTTRRSLGRGVGRDVETP